MRSDHSAIGHFPLLLGIAACLTLLANGVIMFRFSQRLDRIEAQARGSGDTKQRHGANATPDGRYTARALAAVPHASLPIPLTMELASNRLMQARRNALYAPPEQWSRDLDNLLAREPQNLQAEAVHKQWLEEAIVRMNEDQRAPQAEGLQTLCQGRRCMVSGMFQDQVAARRWATRYLLAAGGTFLTNARIAVLPATNGSYATLQLYLY